MLERRGRVTLAEITVGVPALHFTYRCEVTETPFDKITVKDISGPFEYLRCEMLFDALDENRTRVTYRFESKFRSRLMNRVADPIFDAQLRTTLRDLERYIRRRQY